MGTEFSELHIDWTEDVAGKGRSFKKALGKQPRAPEKLSMGPSRGPAVLLLSTNLVGVLPWKMLMLV